jgi:Bacterial Ig-like domain
LAGMRIVVLVAALVLLAPAGARAGTYDVVSCGAPGAGGVNNSLQYSAAAWDPNLNGFAQNQWYVGDATCADGLVARTRTNGSTAHWLSGAGWLFTAPDGTEIVGFSSWRFGEARDFDGDDPNTPYEDEGDHWVAAVTDHTGQPVGGSLGGETCSHGVEAAVCTFGRPGGERRDHRVATSHLRWQVGCAGAIIGGCPVSKDGTPLATIVVYGTRITLEDKSAPAASLTGSLLGPGWHRPTEPIAYSASDNTGIRSAALSAGPLSATDGRSCDFTYKVPCFNASDRPLTFPATLPDGRYPLTLTVTDAAGNPRTVQAPVAIDGTPPAVDLRRPRKRMIIVAVSDRASGFAGGQIDVRNSSTEPYRPLPTRYARGALRAPLDRGKPSKTDVRVTVRDNAGNEITGVPARFRITSVTSQRLRAHVRKRGRVRVKHGHPVTIRGQLVLSAGQPLQGVPITVTSKPIGRNAVPYVEGSTTVGANGRFVIRLAAGPARTAVLRFPGAVGGMPAERRLKLQVPASSTIKASRLRLNGSGLVRFSGRVRGRSVRNLVVVLQGKEGGRWRTFADTRTRKRGRWRSVYRFSGRPGSYPIRVRIRRQRNLPYVTGYSKRVTVHVG